MARVVQVPPQLKAPFTPSCGLCWRVAKLCWAGTPPARLLGLPLLELLPLPLPAVDCCWLVAAQWRLGRWALDSTEGAPETAAEAFMAHLPRHKRGNVAGGPERQGSLAEFKRGSESERQHAQDRRVS